MIAIVKPKKKVARMKSVSNNKSLKAKRVSNKTIAMKKDRKVVMIMMMMKKKKMKMKRLQLIL